MSRDRGRCEPVPSGYNDRDMTDPPPSTPAAQPLEALRLRYFAMHLPPVLTDRERLAEQFIRFAKAQRSARTQGNDRLRDRTLERTR